MSTSLARPVNGRDVLPNLFGFDPFQHLRAGYGFEYDVTRTENGYEVDVPVPGFTSSQVEVMFKDGVLTINGRSDRRSFARSLVIPDDVDPETIEARVENGMLKLALQRHPEARPKKIDVK